MDDPSYLTLLTEPDTEPATVAARPAPAVDAFERTLKFNKPGDSYDVHGNVIAYDRDLGSETIKLIITPPGGEGQEMKLRKGSQRTVSTLNADGKSINLVFTYTGIGVSGTREVKVKVEGLASPLARATGRARGMTSSAMEALPSRWGHIADVIPIVLAPIVGYLAYKMPGVKDALGQLWQHVAVIGTALTVAGLGVWSFIERMRDHQNVR